MSQPLTFSDDEDTLRFSRQLQELDVSRLIPRSRPVESSVNKENLAWKVNDRVKDEPSSPAETYLFRPSPVKRRSGKILLPDSSTRDNNDISPDSIKDEPLDEWAGDENKTPGRKGRLAAIRRLDGCLQLSTPDKACKKEKEEEWDNTRTPTNLKTPRSVVASTKRRRLLLKIKTEMAEKIENTWYHNSDPDFIFVGDEAGITPTPMRLRRRSRISFRNLDWSSDKSDRKRNRHAVLMVDESEEEREAQEEKERQEEEQRRRKTKRRMKRKRTNESASSSVAPAFSISDEEPLAVIAKRMKVGEEDEGGEREAGEVKKEIKEEAKSTELETAFSISDEESLSTIKKRTKRIKVEEEDEEAKSSVLETAFSISDEESLSTIKKGIKTEEKEEREDGEYRAKQKKKKGTVDEEGEGEYTIKRRQR